MGFSSVSNKLWPTNQQQNESKTGESHLEFIKVLVTYFLKIHYLSCCTHCNCLFSETNTSSWSASAGCLGLLYFTEAVERHPKEKQKLVIGGEIPAIWPAIRGDRETAAACETSGRVSGLFAPTAHVKVKSDSSLNPLWTSLTACVIWNAPPPQSFLRPELWSCFTKRTTSDGDLVPFRYVTERWWDLLVRCVRCGWLSALDSARNHTGHWCGSCYLEGFHGCPCMSSDNHN